MEKIIAFSSLGSTETFEGQLESLKHSLAQKNISQKKLQKLKTEMVHLSHALCENLKQEALATSNIYHTWEKQQEELGLLLHTCHHLSVDLCVNKLTLKAKQLAQIQNDNPRHLGKKISKIEKQIKSLNFKEGLSLENRKLIQIAKDLLDSAKRPSQKVAVSSSPDLIRLNFKEEWTPYDLSECSELSLELFDVASLFYEYKLHDAIRAFYQLPFFAQEKLNVLLKKKGIDFDQIKTSQTMSQTESCIYTIVEQLLGFSQELVQGFSEPLSKKDIDALFKDLYINLVEPSANF